MTEPGIPQKLIFTLVKTPNLGITIEAYLVTINSRKQFQIDYQRVRASIAQIIHNIANNEELELLKILDEIHPDIMIRRFTKEKVKPADFFKNVSEDIRKRLITPYVEKRLLKVYELLKLYNIPLFNKHENGIIDNTPIYFSINPAELTPHFTLENDILHYHITLTLDGTEFKLNEPGNQVLTNQPCLLLLNSAIYRFDDIDGKKLLPFLQKPHIEITAQFLDKYMKTFVLQTLNRQQIISSGFEVNERIPDAVPVLSIETGWQQKTIAVLKFKYADAEFSPEENNKRKTKLITDNPYCFEVIERNPEQEKQLISILHQAGFANTGNASFEFREIESLQGDTHLHNFIRLLNSVYEMLREAGFQIWQKLDLSWHLGSFEMEQTIEKSSDWFDLKLTVMIGNFSVPFINFRNHILENQTLYTLPDGSVFLIPEEWFARYQDIFALGTKHGNAIRLLNHQHSLLIEKSSQEDEDAGIQEIYASLKDESKQIASSTNSLLRHYQTEGVRWMICLHEKKLGGCLADDMGLGKTIQVLSLLQHVKSLSLYEEMEIKPLSQNLQTGLFDDPEQSKQTKVVKTALIVMPLSLIHNWEAEIKKFTPELSVYCMIGNGRSNSILKLHAYDVVLTTYGTIRNDISVLKKIPFLYLILDESQSIKNAESRSFQALTEITALHKLVMTGTPIENSLLDLWSQLSIVNPGLLGNRTAFKKFFVNPIEKGNNKQKQERLQQLIHPFILRRKKTDVARELPELTVQIHYCEMSEAQQQIYETRKSEIRNYLLEHLSKFGEDKSRILILSGLTKLRLLANHPKLTEKGYSEDSGKSNEMIDMLHQILEEGHKVLIFSQFVKHLELVVRHLQKEKIPYAMLTGRMNEKERKQAVKQFQNNADTNVFLLSIKAGGVGLNLTAADYIFILDPWWNPAIELQAINRAHRIGQNKSVFAYRFISKETIEEKILRLQEKKQNLADIFVNQNALGMLSASEIIQELI